MPASGFSDLLARCKVQDEAMEADRKRLEEVQKQVGWRRGWLQSVLLQWCWGGAGVVHSCGCC